jgi:hypothetical protein
MRRLSALAALLLTLSGSPAMAVEEPPYTTLIHDGAYELRHYGPRIVAQVSVPGSQWQAANRGFRLLAAYIFGGNTTRTSLPMTAPVALQRAGATIPMTAPVTQTHAGAGWIVSFFMPQGATLQSLPTPNNRQIHLQALPQADLAVLRYAGWATESGLPGKSAALLNWVRAHHLRPAGPVSLAQYNPPWTLWFMRRNEVMVPVTPAPVTPSADTPPPAPS